MATHRLSSVLRSLLHRVAPAAPGEVNDAVLLERFVRSRDEAAFELLIWRHGPMVLSLCQRLLHNEQDAEDAFQATFLILVRKARTIGKREALAGWLYMYFSAGTGFMLLGLGTLAAGATVFLAWARRSATWPFARPAAA